MRNTPRGPRPPETRRREEPDSWMDRSIATALVGWCLVRWQVWQTVRGAVSRIFRFLRQNRPFPTNDSRWSGDSEPLPAQSWLPETADRSRQPGGSGAPHWPPGDGDPDDGRSCTRAPGDIPHWIAVRRRRDDRILSPEDCVEQDTGTFHDEPDGWEGPGPSGCRRVDERTKHEGLYENESEEPVTGADASSTFPRLPPRPTIEAEQLEEGLRLSRPSEAEAYIVSGVCMDVER